MQFPVVFSHRFEFTDRDKSFGGIQWQVYVHLGEVQEKTIPIGIASSDEVNAILDIPLCQFALVRLFVDYLTV